MSMARFHMICDRCNSRGPEYDFSHALKCRSCGEDICAACRVKDSEREDSSCLCRACLLFWWENEGMRAAEDARQDCADCNGSGIEAGPMHDGGQWAVESDCRSCDGRGVQ